MTFPSTSVPDQKPVGVEGGLRYVNGLDFLDSRKADGAIPFGLAVVDEGADQCRVPPVTDPSADDDAVMTSVASSTSAVRFDKDDADGVLGAQLNPARRLTVNTSTSNDFAASTGVLRYMSNGRLISEDVDISTDGDDHHTSAEFADEFVDLYLPAQAGTGGGITIGVTAELGDLVAGVAARDASIQMAASQTGYADEDMVGVFRGRGEAAQIYVRVEDDVVKGGQAYVRLVATGGERVGAFRGDPDGSATAPDCVALRGGTYAAAASAGELAPLQIK